MVILVPNSAVILIDQNCAKSSGNILIDQLIITRALEVPSAITVATLRVMWG